MLNVGDTVLHTRGQLALGTQDVEGTVVSVDGANAWVEWPDGVTTRTRMVVLRKLSDAVEEDA